MILNSVQNSVMQSSGGSSPVSWSPSTLFAASEQGVWYDPSDFSTMFQDSAGTVPVTAVGQPVGKLLDKSGRGNHATQATAGARPILRQDGSGKYYLEFDGADDTMALPALDSTTSTIAVGAITANTTGDYALVSTTKQITYANQSAAPTWGCYNNVSILSSYANTAKLVMIQRTRAFNDIDLFTNNNAVETKTTGTGFNTRPTSLGSSGAAQYAPSNIYGIIVTLYTMTDTQVANVKTYLNTKTGAY